MDDGSSPSTEIYPSTMGCSPPNLPTGRYGHTTFVTAEPTALVATCGGLNTQGNITASPRGNDTASCLVFDPINQRWDKSRMGNLTMPRAGGAVVQLNNIGVFIVGGALTYNRWTSDFLAAGTMDWQAGPTLPTSMSSPCAVTITPTSQGV